MNNTPPLHASTNESPQGMPHHQVMPPNMWKECQGYPTRVGDEGSLNITRDQDTTNREI